MVDGCDRIRAYSQRAMKLKKYIALKKMNIQQLADALGVSHENARRYVHEIRFPRPSNANKIVAYTKGAVSLKDIYGDEARG